MGILEVIRFLVNLQSDDVFQAIIETAAQKRAANDAEYRLNETIRRNKDATIQATNKNSTSNN